MSESTPAAKIEEGGFEALHRLYAIATRDTGQARVAAHFLLGLYNGTRFPFDLTELRGIDTAIYQDCVAVLHLDARVTRREIHTYFDEGGKKFESLVREWNVRDIAKLEATGDGSPTPAPKRGVLHDGDRVQARLETYGGAPGYRDVSLELECEYIGLERDQVGTVRLSVSIGAGDAVRIMDHVREVNESAWRNGSPIDVRPGESRPAWL